MAEKKFLDQGGLSHLWSKIKAIIDTKVPTSRTVNGKALSSDISLNYSDVGAASSGHNHDGRYIYSDVEYFQSSGGSTVTLPAMRIGEMRLARATATGYSEVYVKLPAGGNYTVFTDANKTGKYSGGSTIAYNYEDGENVSVTFFGFYIRIS